MATRWRSGRRLPVAEGPFPWSASRVRLMNSSVEEFRRALVQAFGAAVSDTATGLLLTGDGVPLHFALERQASHFIGALQLTMLRVETVSYTHLDVYKRQVYAPTSIASVVLS